MRRGDVRIVRDVLAMFRRIVWARWSHHHTHCLWWGRRLLVAQLGAQRNLKMVRRAMCAIEGGPAMAAVVRAKHGGQSARTKKQRYRSEEHTSELQSRGHLV